MTTRTFDINYLTNRSRKVVDLPNTRLYRLDNAWWRLLKLSGEEAECEQFKSPKLSKVARKTSSKELTL